ncbi:MAG TPA: MarR family winged helix-turn-helix transcriptional regulator [Azospirillaceae bacterium]|nr:MarR family winged helix-turn-helix transcriptional regulator [Azospirillaceae bacterium]
MTGDFSRTKRTVVSASKPQAGKDASASGVLPDSSVGYLVRDVHRSFTRALQARIASHGVSMGQWFFLRALWDEDGLTQRELSQRVGMMEPTTVTALNSMERRGLVERVRNPHDRRKVNIYLTPKGRGLREVLLPCAADVSDQATRGITAENLALTVDVLRRMGLNLGDDGVLTEIE